VFSDQRSSTDTANINYTDKVTLPAAGGASSALRQASGFTNDNKRALTMSGRPSLMLMKHRESAGGAKVCSSGCASPSMYSQLIELDETPQALKKRRKIMEAEEKQKRKDEQEHMRERIEEEKEKRKQQIIDMKEAKRKAKETVCLTTF
jgi:ribosomal protein L2